MDSILSWIYGILLKIFFLIYISTNGLNSTQLPLLKYMALQFVGKTLLCTVTLPKDLFWSDSRRNGFSFENVSSNNSNVVAPEHRLEIAKHRWNRIGLIMGKTHVRKFCWNLKIQFQVLKYPAISIQRFSGLNLLVKTMDMELIDNLYYMLSPLYLKDAVDMCIVAWILLPDEEKSSSPNLEKEVKKRLSSEAAAAANRSGRWRNQMRRAAHNGCCRRVAQTRALFSVLWKLLTSGSTGEYLAPTGKCSCRYGAYGNRRRYGGLPTITPPAA